MSELKIYRLSWPGYDKPRWYDRYDSCVVVATSPKDARTIHPSGDPKRKVEGGDFDSWTTPDQIECELIGTAARGQKRGIICASFNAA